MGAIATPADVLPRLPRRLSDRVQRMEKARNLDRKHDEALHLMQDTILYLASIAFADYRARAPEPSLEVERLLMGWKKAWLEDYGDLLRHALNATPAPLLSPDEQRGMTFPAATRLRTAMEGLDAAAQGHASTARPIVDSLLRRSRKSIAFTAMRETLKEFRNKAYAHVDRTHWDRVDDYLEVTAPLLADAAIELVSQPLVRRMLASLDPVTIVESSDPDETGSRSLRVRHDTGDERWLEIDRDDGDLVQGRLLALAPVAAGEAEVRGSFWLLLENHDIPRPLANEVVRAALDRNELERALKALETFLLAKEPDVDPDIDPSLVDTAIVLVLERYKTTCEPPYYELVERLNALLDHQSEALPDRLTQDVEYLTDITVDRPLDGGGLKRPEEVLLARLRSPRGKERCAAADGLGYLDTPAARRALEAVARDDPRRAVRKHALYSLARMAAPESWPTVARVASGERNDPELTAHALNALSAFPTAENVTFLFDYLRTGAVYPCTCAAAASVVALSLEAPGTLSGREDDLFALIEGMEHAYTRGCLIFAFGGIGNRDVIPRLLTLTATDTRPYVVEDLCATLGMLGGDGAVAFLERILTQAQLAHRDCVVQRQAILALRRIDTPAAREALRGYVPPPAFPVVARALHEPLA